MTGLPPLTGWVPGRVHWDDARPLEGARVDWVHMPDARFTEPFFEDTLTRAMRRPANGLFRHQTTLAQLKRWREISPGIAPTGFIFHVSRCGSTLMTQMLARLPDALVLSEAPPIDAVLRADQTTPRLGEAECIAVLRAMVSALGQARAEGQARLFVKFDAWSALQLPLIRAAFPDTPILFLYRDPLEVLVSQRRQPGLHMSPWMVPPEHFGLPAEARTWDADLYGARMLAAIYQAGLTDHARGRSLLLNYSQFPETAWTRAALHFGIDPAELAPDMRQAALDRDVKSGLPFVEDGADKQAEATPEMRHACEQYMDPVYRALEAVRIEGPDR